MDFFEYTPALQEPETLESTLVGRNSEIKNINRIFKSASSGKSISHPLFIGPKGIGKTHLLQFINHAVQGEIKGHGLNKYKKEFIPVIFPEEEYIDTITQFISLVWKYLPENVKKLFPGIDKQINASPVNEKSKEHAISFLETFKKKTGKTLLILVDNLNDILENFTEEDQSILRKILMTSNSILFVGAAPTLFSSVINHDEPLYNFFEVIGLKDLPFKEAKALLTGYAKLDQKDDLIKEIDKSEAKIRAIHELAGGNPRLILRLYHIISEGDISSVETSLLKLLDGLSPYFRERIKDLSPQQRKIIDVMAKSDILLTPTEIAAHSHLPIGTINSQIKRLEQIGYVKKASQRKKKRVLYEINERLFCLWRQMRVEAGRKRLGIIVRFLEIWYTKEELLNTLDKTLDEMHKAISCDCGSFETCLDNLWHYKETVNGLKGKDVIYVAYKRGKYDVALGLVNNALKKTPKDADLLERKSYIFTAKKEYNKAIKSLNEAKKLGSKSHSLWFSLANAYNRSKQYDKAVETFYNEVKIAPDNYCARNHLSEALFNLRQYDNAKKVALETEKADKKCFHSLEILLKIYKMLFVEEGLKGNFEIVVRNLRELLEVHKKTENKKLVHEFFVSSLKTMVEKNNIDLIKTTLNEIRSAKQNELLRPFSKLIDYLETRDLDVIERLRKEERKVVEEMIRELEKYGPEVMVN